MRLIGMGSLERGDDGAGRAVARRVRERAPAGIEVVEVEGEATGLIEAWRGAGRVIVVDTFRSGRPPGTILRVDPATEEIPAPAGGSTHGLGLAEALALGRALGELPPGLLIYGIEGGSFGVGARLSPPVAAAVARLAESILSGAVP